MEMSAASLGTQRSPRSRNWTCASRKTRLGARLISNTGRKLLLLPPTQGFAFGTLRGQEAGLRQASFGSDPAAELLYEHAVSIGPVAKRAWHLANNKPARQCRPRASGQGATLAECGDSNPGLPQILSAAPSPVGHTLSLQKACCNPRPAVTATASGLVVTLQSELAHIHPAGASFPGDGHRRMTSSWVER